MLTLFPSENYLLHIVQELNHPVSFLETQNAIDIILILFHNSWMWGEIASVLNENV